MKKGTRIEHNNCYITKKASNCFNVHSRQYGNLGNQPTLELAKKRAEHIHDWNEYILSDISFHKHLVDCGIV